MSDGFPFVRITVLGSEACGKTSLINSFVNNSCPTVHIPTTYPQLYYKVVRLPPEGEERGPVSSLCVEIEDTFASDVNGGEEGEGTTKANSLRYFVDMRRKRMVMPKGVEDFTPFGLWKPPRVPLGFHKTTYTPLTQGRMGYLLVFDVEKKESFEEVCQIHKVLQDAVEAQSGRVKPVIYFVANKIDKNPTGEATTTVTALAERYAQQQFVRLMKVSAREAKNVKRTFHDMLYIILGNQLLWEIEYDQKEDEGEEDDDESDKQQGCTQS